MKHLAGCSVLILGLGASGLAMARWCRRQGARVQVWDSREQAPMREALEQEAGSSSFFSGPLDPAVLLDVHLVLKSPGLSPLDPQVAPLLQAAQADRVPVAAELALFARALADLQADRGYAPQVLAITGTNGKTTATQLTGLLLQRSGRRVAVAGNIGPTLLDTLSQALDAAEQDRDVLLPEVWVLELSSFQLDGVEGFEPTAAAVLNITQDHLDWHGDMAHYVQAKSRVFGPSPRIQEDASVALSSTIMVINRSDERVAALEPAPIAVKGTRGRAAKPLVRRTLRFGLDAPSCPGDFGLVVERGMAWLVRAHPQDEEEGRSACAADEELHLQRLMPADALRIRGRHNAANALAALALATAIGCPLGVMLHGLREYTGELHRMSFVLRAADIDVYDDSKGTNVGATVAAVQGLGQDIEPARLVLLLGGDGKGQDFSPLRGPLARHVRAVALYGRDAPAIADALTGLDLPIQRHTNLVAASAWAFEQAHRGDSVLLSPACASLDQFRDYKHRAGVFVGQAQAWAQAMGAVA